MSGFARRTRDGVAEQAARPLSEGRAITAAEAVSSFPDLRPLISDSAVPWAFRVQGEATPHRAVYGTRTDGVLLDAITVQGVTDASAARIRTVRGSRTPMCTWRRSHGRLDEVVAEMLELPSIGRRR